MTATNISEIVTGLSTFGSDLGGMLQNLVPGVIAFMIGVAIAGGIVLIFKAVFGSVTKKLN